MQVHERALQPLLSRAAAIDSQRIERWMWIGVWTFWVFGDNISTIIAEELGGTETNEYAVWFMEVLGYPGLFLQKLLCVVVIALTCHVITISGRKLGSPASPFRSAFLAIFVIAGIFATLWNSYVIYTLIFGGYAVPPV